jgi:type I restriction enzyme S subunit
MNSNFLLQHFERIAEAPDAVSRLRQFILDLAVRGKLVEQDPNDEPASELLGIVRHRRKQLIEERAVKQKKTKTFPRLDKKKMSYEAPESWEWVRLVEIGFTQTGNTPSRNAPEYFGDYIPFIKPADLDGNSISYVGEGISREGLQFARLIHQHSVLMVCIGSSIGKVNITDRDVCCNQQINTITPYHEELTSFVALVLKSDFFQKLVLSNAAAGTLSIISKGKWEILPIPFPPLAEQHRIVTKVDELMALCDELKATQTKREKRRDRLVASSLNGLNNGNNGDEFRENARFYFNHLPRLTTRPEHIQQLRQTILNLAVQGRLVPQDPTDQPATKLFTDIVKCRDKICEGLGLRRQPRLTEPEISKQAFTVPDSWIKSAVDQCFVVTGGIQKTPNRTPRSNAFPYLGVGNVYRGRLELSEVKQFELSEGELEKWRLKTGDLLIVEGNGSASEIGRCARWNDEIADCVHQNHIIRCRPGNPAIARFAEMYLNSPIGIEVMRKLAVTSAGLYNLSVGKIRRIWLPLPPLAEQHRIVAKVDELLGVCAELEAGLTAGTITRRKLLEAALHEALNGIEIHG